MPKLNWLKAFFLSPPKIEERIKDIQIDLKHSKMRLDQIEFYLQKIYNEGIKVKR